MNSSIRSLFPRTVQDTQTDSWNFFRTPDMTRALGGTTEKASHGWGIGKHVSTVLLRRPTWMTSIAYTYGVFYSNQNQVTRLPSSATLLAGNHPFRNATFTFENIFLGGPESPRNHQCIGPYSIQTMSMRERRRPSISLLTSVY